MKYLILLTLLIALLAQAATVGVSVHVPCTNDNYETSPYCTAAPDYFVVESNGEAWGYLTSGAAFTQTNVTNELGVKLQRFQLEQAYWYVTDKGEIYAANDLEALSVYLSK